MERLKIQEEELKISRRETAEATRKAEEAERKLDKAMREAEEFKSTVESVALKCYFEDDRELPELQLVNQKSGLSTNFKHRPVDEVEVKTFGVVDFSPTKNSEWFSSKILCESTIRVATDADVHGMVKILLNEVMEAVGVKKDLALYNEMEITELKADIWILSHNGHPVGALEVKKPGNVSPEAQNIHFGQLYDYLLRIRSFYGLKYVLGLYTNWDEWRFGWLSDSDASAEASNLDYAVDGPINQLQDTRVLHVSQIFTRRNSKPLANALGSWFKKLIFNANFVTPVALFAPERAYIYLTKKSWGWRQGIPINSAELSMPRYGVNTFYLLRDFHGATDGRVWLACHIKQSLGENIGQIVVLKFISRIAIGKEGNERTVAMDEVSRWHKLGITSVYCTTLAKRCALVMPLGFHYSSSGQQIDSTWWDDYDPTKIPITDFQEWYTKAAEYDPTAAMKECIKSCADAKLVHSDIQWRHVALVPQYVNSEFGMQKVLKVQFIDLSQMTTVDTSDEAESKMLEMVATLEKDGWDWD